jgi:hypothetical protein
MTLALAAKIFNELLLNDLLSLYCVLRKKEQNLTPTPLYDN